MITLQQFDALERGMSYKQACQILGEEGALISSESAQIEPGIQVMALQTEIFEWRNEDGASIRLMFKQDALNEITQTGLSPDIASD